MINIGKIQIAGLNPDDFIQIHLNYTDKNEVNFSSQTTTKAANWEHYIHGIGRHELPPEFDKTDIYLQTQIFTHGGKQLLSFDTVQLPNLYIPLKFQVFHIGEQLGQGSNISDAQVKSAVDRLNYDFAPSGIQFILKDINRVNLSQNEKYRNFGLHYKQRKGLTMPQILTLLGKQLNNAQCMSIISATQYDGNKGRGGMQGFAHLPGKRRGYLTVLANTIGTTGKLKHPRDFQTVLTHEMGHRLGLGHTKEKFNYMSANFRFHNSFSTDQTRKMRRVARKRYRKIVKRELAPKVKPANPPLV